MAGVSLGKNIKSTRMAKEKLGDEQLEDEIWCAFAQMGFKEMSQGRQFTISVGNDLPPDRLMSSLKTTRQQ